MNPTPGRLASPRWLAALGMLAACGCFSRPVEPPPVPRLLSQTGLDGRAIGFEPQYPLWTDGAQKRRWLRLPEGAAIDASHPDRWQVPVGTVLWKEFSFGGRKVETRTIERLADGSYRFAAYVWNAEGTDAVLAPEKGLKGVAATSPTTRHDIPGVEDCKACHEGRANVVLGLSALQLSSQLEALVRRGAVAQLPEGLLKAPPRLAAASEPERAALGYLLGNCAHCHNAEGPLASLELDFDQRAEAAAPRAAAVGQPSRFRFARYAATLRIAPGRPDESIALLRMRSRDPAEQMPPLGTHLADPEGLRAVSQWIETLTPNEGETP